MAKVSVDPEPGQAEPGEPAYIQVHAITEDGELVETAVQLFYKPEAIGTAPVACLVFGIPGTQEFAFWDLTDLPDQGSPMTVTIEVAMGDHVLSRSKFIGKTGNNPQARD